MSGYNPLQSHVSLIMAEKLNAIVSGILSMYDTLLVRTRNAYNFQMRMEAVIVSPAGAGRLFFRGLVCEFEAKFHS